MNDMEKAFRTNEQEESEYEVYDYLKSNPTVAISGISACVLVLSFFIKALIYVNECRYLKYWGLDKSLVDISDTNRIYEYVALGVLYFVMILCMRFLEVSLEKLRSRVSFRWYEKRCRMGIKKEHKKQKRINRKNVEDGRIAVIIKGLEERKRIIEEVKDVRKKQCGERRIKIFGTIILVVIILTLTLCLFTIFYSGESAILGNFVVSLLLTIVFSIVFYVLGGSAKKEKKNYKLLSIDSKVERYQQLIHLYSKNKEQYPIDKLQRFEVKTIFSKTKLRNAISYVVITLCSILLFVVQGDISNDSKTQFEIIECDDTKYAIIYKDDAFFYLKEAKICEKSNVIYIVIDNQIRMQMKDIYSKNMAFEDAVRIYSDGKKVDS